MAKLRDMYFKRIDLGNIDNNLDSDSVKLLQAFDGHTAFFQIQQTVGLQAAVFKKSFLELYQKKLIKEVNKTSAAPPAQETYLDAAVIDELRSAAIQVAGPVGELLIDDALEDLKLSPSKIPSSRLPDLTKAILYDIPGEKQRNLFREKLPKYFSLT